ncbi:MAG: transposase, partial [Enterococcus sp.]|nr:transposase [Enterococcus sp.]
NVLHIDETTVQVLKEPGKAAQSKSYMWVYRTSGKAKNHIILYDYHLTEDIFVPENS